MNQIKTIKNNAEEYHNKIMYIDFFVNHLVIIDLSSLKYDADIKFWHKILPFLYKNNFVLHITKITLDLFLSSRLDDTIVEQLIEKNNTKQFIEIYEQPVECSNEAEAIASFINKNISNINILLLSQDFSFVDNLLSIGLVSSKWYKLDIKRINKYGFFQDYYYESKDNLKTLNDFKLLSKEKYKEIAVTTNISDQILIIDNVPIESEIVFTDKKEPIKLNKQINKGGEGTVYDTQNGLVAKIYDKKALTLRKKNKIELMISKPIRYKGICYPRTILFNSDNQFIGYLMDKAEGRSIGGSFFIKDIFLKNYPDWNKKNILELCITIVEKIKYLHDRNILLGDINLGNILVKSSSEVFFVDTDSYQVEEFPCPVTSQQFTAPEMIGKDLKNTKRTKDNEYYAIAVLIFNLLMMGKFPYPISYENDEENDFMYPFFNYSNPRYKDTNVYARIWSYLPYYIKKSFYYTFKKGEKFHKHYSRINTDTWLFMLNKYLRSIDDMINTQKNKEYLDLFPNNLNIFH